MSWTTYIQNAIIIIAVVAGIILLWSYLTHYLRPGELQEKDAIIAKLTKDNTRLTKENHELRTWNRIYNARDGQ